MISIYLRNLFLTCGILFGMSIQVAADETPAEVTRLSNAVEAIPGVDEASVGNIYLPDISLANLSLPGTYADLPIASIRRSNGGLPDELLISIDFSITRDARGLKALEFLAWWVKDQSRGGENMQLRAIGLPPIAGKTVQLGDALRFTIDWFYVSPSQDMTEVLKALSRSASALEFDISLYEEAFH